MALPPTPHLRLDLRREGAEFVGADRIVPLYPSHDRAGRRAHHPDLNRDAYRLFRALGERAAAPDLAPHFAHRGVPLLPLMQRHLTEGLVALLRARVALQRVLTVEQPVRLTVAEPAALPLARSAAVGLPTLVHPEQPVLPLDSAKHAALGLVRHAWYLPRLAAQRRLRPHLPLKQPGRPRLLFLPYYPNHLPSFLPLLRELVAQQRYEVIVAYADTNSRRRGDVDPAPLDPLGVPHLPVEALAPWPLILEAMARGSWRAARLGALVRSPRFRAGLALDEGEALLAGPLLARLVETHLPKILLYLDLVDALYAHLDPDLVVVTDETLPVLGRVALRAAQRRAVPTLTIQHGLMLDDPMYYGPAVADRLAVWGEQTHDFLVEHGCPPERLAVTGSTRFDHLDPSGETLDLAGLLALPPGTRVVLFTSQPGGRDVSPAANRATLESLVRAVAALPDAHLLVKPHPAQTAAELADWHTTLDTLGAPATIRPDLPLHPAMRGAALCATVFSTTGLEALRLDRPLLTVNLTDKPDPLPYAASGAALAAYEASAVLPALRQALDPADAAARAGARHAFVRGYLGPLDGRANERLLALIDEMTG